MRILLTGAAGFIGMHTAEKLAEKGHEVVGIDNVNDYYDTWLKRDRLKHLGLKEGAADDDGYSISTKYPNLSFKKMDISDKQALESLTDRGRFDVICNMAAQAGVRYSIENPESYINSNIVGFFNILEFCRHHDVSHLVYASSSSVYGANDKVPYSTNDKTDSPVSLYAATKKSNELMAYAYSKLYGFKATGLRFFTVYGPWGRPDMAPFLFTDAISDGREIKVFNNGDMMRDFTYIDDIVKGLCAVIESVPSHDEALHNVYNIGNNTPVKLLDFIAEIEEAVGRKARKIFLPMQQGDVQKTWADIEPMRQKFGYSPDFSLKEGITKFVEWYRSYYGR